MPDLILKEAHANGVWSLTFNRPDVRNALNWAAQEAFLAAIRDLVSDEAVRALILTGAGDKAFCAGGDLLELADYPTEADGQRVTAVMGEALALLEAAPFPSITAMNGHALGGGGEIALACDVRIIDEGAKMGFLQMRLGLTPGWGAGQRLLHLVGYSRALELLLRAEPFTAAEALKYGLVNQVAPSGEAFSEAKAFAAQIAGWDQNAVRSAKRILRAGLLESDQTAREIERMVFPPLWSAEAHLNAVKRFLDRS